MQCELVAVLGEANRAISALVSRLCDNSAGAERINLSTSELKALARKLAQVAKLLGRVPSTPPGEPALQAVLREYVDNLQRLKGVLGTAMDSLGKRRDQIRRNLEHLSSARAWAETFRATN
jgi:hypothetical protein